VQGFLNRQLANPLTAKCIDCEQTIRAVESYEGDILITGDAPKWQLKFYKDWGGIVGICLKNNNRYKLIDGFHRYTVLTEYLKQKEIPVVVLEHDIKKRMAATIQFNRARGTHQIIDMGTIVSDLFIKGWSDEQICEHLGMELDEVIRLKQVCGLKEAFQDFEFSKSWNEYTFEDILEVEDDEL